jgi:hypothetical protein
MPESFMATRVSVSDKWLAAGDERAVRRRLLAFLDECEMEVTGERDGEVEADQGSQLRTRLLGGWFVNARHLPKRVRITYRETEDGVRVRATIEETLGFGFMDPLLEQKYETFFNDWLDDLRDAVR